jgi:hypothetical protein
MMKQPWLAAGLLGISSATPRDDLLRLRMAISRNFLMHAQIWMPSQLLVAFLFVASSIGQLAKHLSSAGGFATYTSRGLHPSVGFMVSWLYILAEASIGLLASKRAAHTG